jgi:hypothetical protein
MWRSWRVSAVGAARTIGQSVVISAPVIAVMFILGTSMVLTFIGGQPINMIGPIPQTFRAAFGTAGVAGFAAQFGIALLMARAVASASLIFTGLTRLPMATGWDNLVPRWFSPAGPAAAHARELHLLCRGTGYGPDSAEPAGSQGARGQPVADAGLDRALRHRVRGLFALPLFGSRSAALPTADLAEGGRGGRHGIEPGGTADFRLPPLWTWSAGRRSPEKSVRSSS